MIYYENTKSDELANNSTVERLENEADEFSCDILIPQADYDEFLAETGGRYTAVNIVEFANRINILPGIVVGRLQHDNYLKQNSSLNSLKKKYI